MLQGVIQTLSVALVETRNSCKVAEDIFFFRVLSFCIFVFNENLLMKKRFLQEKKNYEKDYAWHEFIQWLAWTEENQEIWMNHSRNSKCGKQKFRL